MLGKKSCNASDVSLPSSGMLRKKLHSTTALFLFSSILLLAFAGAQYAASCNLTLGAVCAANGTMPSCCGTGLACSLAAGAPTGACCVSVNSSASCSSDSDCCIGRCVSGKCAVTFACNAPCSVHAECGSLCPICAESSGNYSCKSCIPAGSLTVCGSSSDCCSGYYCSPTDSKCTACFGNGTLCDSDSECCSSRCEYNAAGVKSCLAAKPSCMMEGGPCSTGADCCGSPPANSTLYCDTYNPNPSSSLPGTCRSRVPPGAACNATSGINCSNGYSCMSTASGYRCTASAVGNHLPTGWLVVGDAQFDVNGGSPHSGSNALEMNMSGYPTSYIYDNSLVLKNSTRYYMEFWVNASAGPVRYAIYDPNNDAYLGSTGDWVASPRNSQGYEDPPILSASVSPGPYALFGRSFYTLSKNVSHVQLRLYPPLDGSRAFVDDVAVTEIYDFTLMGWIRAGYPQADGAALFYQMGTENGSQQGINWSLNSSNWLNMGIYSARGGSIIPAVNLSDQGLHQFALSVDRAGNYSAYLDGQPVSTGSFTLGRLNNTGTFYIGASGVSGASFKGALDEVRLYHRALSASEIAAQYQGYYQSLCIVDMNASYSNIAGIASKNMSANYNAYLRLRNIAPETILSMPFDANISSDLQGDIPDFSRSLSAGTKTGATWTSGGKIGGAYNFTSATDKIQLAGPLVSGTGDFTLAAWIYPMSAASHVEYIMGNYGSGNSGGVEFYTSSNRLGLSIGSAVTSSANSIQPNTWYHAAATRRNGQVALYINAAQDGNGALASSITGSRNFAIGNGPDYTTEDFMGTIDEVQVFSKALSADEIRGLYNDSGLAYFGQVPSAFGLSCPGGSSSLCEQMSSSFIPSKCGFLGQLCCFSYGSYSCSGIGTFCNTSSSQPSCQACGASGQACCTGSTCTSVNLICSSGTCQCGASSQPCCKDASGNYNCSTSALGCNMTASPPTCQTCGGANQTCCAANNCSAGFTCTSGICQCGGPLQKCCGGTTCTPGLGLTCNATTGYCNLPCGVQGAQCCWPGNTCNSTSGDSSNPNLACYGGSCDCGTIGKVCCAGSACNIPSYMYCNASSTPKLCQHCGNLGESCCTGNGNSCNGTTLGCNTTSMFCQACGGLGQICCSGNCSATYACNTSISPLPLCQACGASAGQLCCYNATSAAYDNCTGGASLACNTSISPLHLCQACGGAGQLCCAGNNCTAPGYACNTSASPLHLCQACGGAAGQLCCYNATSAAYDNCTGAVSLVCNATASPKVCYTSTGCTQNSDCSAGQYCNSSSACAAQKGAGGTCNYSVTGTGSSAQSNGVCSSGYCRDGYSGSSNGNGTCDSASESCWCSSGSTDCEYNATSYANAAYAPDCNSTRYRRVCSSGAWAQSTDCYASDTSSDSGTTLGGGVCSASRYACNSTGFCAVAATTSGTDTCGGTSDAPNVTYYYLTDMNGNGINDTCNSSVTNRTDNCSYVAPSCTAINYACSGGLLSNSTSSGTDSCTGSGSPYTCSRSTYSCTNADGGSVADTCTAGSSSITSGYVCTGSGTQTAGSSTYYSSQGANYCSTNVVADRKACDGSGGTAGSTVATVTISTCSGNTICSGSSCVACGTIGQICCTGSTCPVSGSCSAGSCAGTPTCSEGQSSCNCIVGGVTTVCSSSTKCHLITGACEPVCACGGYTCGHGYTYPPGSGVGTCFCNGAHTDWTWCG